jgi:hypothetical protein
MIAVDTSSFVAYLEGGSGGDVDAVDAALAQKQVVLPPVVLTEILSNPKLPGDFRRLLVEIPLLEITEGFWERAGHLRSRVLARGRKARIADALIAQSCIDYGVPLITRDGDFRHFFKLGGLRLIPS